MTKPQAFEVPLVNHLIKLDRDNDLGALAALRAGLGKPPGTVPRMFPIVAPFLDKDSGPLDKGFGPRTIATFVIAPLFALHLSHGPVGSIGASLWRATKSDGNPSGTHGHPGVEARLIAALEADKEDLGRHLHGLVALCDGVPIDWHQFCRDVRGLFGDNEVHQTRIRTKWARDFWAGPHKSNSNNETDQEDTEL